MLAVVAGIFVFGVVTAVACVLNEIKRDAVYREREGQQQIKFLEKWKKKKK